jgi:hypothetical protein
MSMWPRELRECPIYVRRLRKMGSSRIDKATILSFEVLSVSQPQIAAVLYCGWLQTTCNLANLVRA